MACQENPDLPGKTASDLQAYFYGLLPVPAPAARSHLVRQPPVFHGHQGSLAQRRNGPDAKGSNAESPHHVESAAF
jgi:hypothetical protein